MSDSTEDVRRQMIADGQPQLDLAGTAASSGQPRK